LEDQKGFNKGNILGLLRHRPRSEGVGRCDSLSDRQTATI